MKKLTLFGLVVVAGLFGGCKKEANWYKADLTY